MKTPKHSSKLLRPKKAVESYLDSLLHDEVEFAEPTRIKQQPLLTPDITAEPDQVIEGVVDADPRPEATTTDSSPIEPSSIESVPVEPEMPPVLMVEDPSAKKTIERIQTFKNQQTSPTIEPEIIQSLEEIQRYDFPLQCLMFKVSGNQLSIPLIDMGSVLPWGAKLTTLPHTPDWFLGLLIHRDENVRVVNTAKFMNIPEISQDDDSRHILVFGNESWAITCDSLGDVIKLNEKDVKWTRKGVSNLMLGTIKSSLAILLDPEKLLMQMKQQF